MLLTSSIAMGGIGIWSMHFIGNRAVILGDGDSHIQILYSVPYTGLSFVCPVLILFTAFYTVGASEKAGYLRIISGGVLTGAAVFGMHYIGQMGISNYNLDYHVANFVGSFVIAILASTVALAIFFRWKATWTDCWWRRVICGVFLAGAVSGMHWTATVGTLYRDYDKSVKPKGQISRDQTAIICFVFVSWLKYHMGAWILTTWIVYDCLRNLSRMCYSCWWTPQTTADPGTAGGSHVCFLRPCRAYHGHTACASSQSEGGRPVYWQGT